MSDALDRILGGEVRPADAPTEASWHEVWKSRGLGGDEPLVTATIGAISIGIGIDFAIHFTMRYRQEMALTNLELARNAGISQGMLSKIENGQISPSLATLRALSSALSGASSRSSGSPLLRSISVTRVSGRSAWMRSSPLQKVTYCVPVSSCA